MRSQSRPEEYKEKQLNAKSLGIEYESECDMDERLSSAHKEGIANVVSARVPRSLSST
jgi:hypothetical protein